MRELRLFEAIGGADPELLERSEQSRKDKSHWWAIAAAAVACLLLVVSLGDQISGESSTTTAEDACSDTVTEDTVTEDAGTAPEDGGADSGETAGTETVHLVIVQGERYFVDSEGNRYGVTESAADWLPGLEEAVLTLLPAEPETLEICLDDPEEPVSAVVTAIYPDQEDVTLELTYQDDIWQ